MAESQWELISVEKFPMLTVEEAAREVQLSPATLYRYMAIGSLKYFQLGRRRRIYRDDLAAWLEAHRAKGAVEALGSAAPATYRRGL